ncbi:hypothetical protein [Vibrio sp. SCSIO 43136]|uniref:hypothetical protein n=1 Tax=Vibrio sp. SCSIO 43136 TaxID=2819101 RepID=UPI0020762383|nr:hypothetical protein [Vibrio sp. SCSIO 43136]USD65810.1 hypothetical protein J4N39_03010 [Vibrio sp. SCSIO 43136]
MLTKRQLSTSEQQISNTATQSSMEAQVKALFDEQRKLATHLTEKSVRVVTKQPSHDDLDWL